MNIFSPKVFLAGFAISFSSYSLGFHIDIHHRMTSYALGEYGGAPSISVEDSEGRVIPLSFTKDMIGTISYESIKSDTDKSKRGDHTLHFDNELLKLSLIHI